METATVSGEDEEEPAGEVTVTGDAVGDAVVGGDATDAEDAADEEEVDEEDILRS